MRGYSVEGRLLGLRMIDYVTSEVQTAVELFAAFGPDERLNGGARIAHGRYPVGDPRPPRGRSAAAAMGVVFKDKAEDTRLHCAVGLEFLPPELLHDSAAFLKGIPIGAATDWLQVQVPANRLALIS